MVKLISYKRDIMYILSILWFWFCFLTTKKLKLANDCDLGPSRSPLTSQSVPRRSTFHDPTLHGPRVRGSKITYFIVVVWWWFQKILDFDVFVFFQKKINLYLVKKTTDQQPKKKIRKATWNDLAFLFFMLHTLYVGLSWKWQRFWFWGYNLAVCTLNQQPQKKIRKSTKTAMLLV